MKIRAIIVDDEPLAREGVRQALSEETDVEVLAECADGVEAIKAVEKHRPDLLFLDVQMPRLNGFEVLEALEPEQIPAVIFTTAHDEHAIRAFEVNALDYLLKPFKQARFQKALQRAREQLHARGGSGIDPQISGLLANLRRNASGGPRILVKSPDRILFLKPDDIDHIEAAGNYLVLHSGKERHIARDTMTAMENRLAAAGFMRISRSVIVNLSRIRELQPLGAGEYSVILKTGARLNMTCNFGELQERMGKL
jgi:two-component system, LytTR family, response regulator